MSDPTEAVISALGRGGYSPCSLGPDTWESRCPAHQGSRSNLSIRRGEGGRCLLYCHHVEAHGGGCTIEAIVGALGMTESELFEPKPSSIAGAKKAGKGKSKKVHATLAEAVKAITWSLRQPRDGRADSTWAPRAHWIYHHADGAESFLIMRFQNATGGKEGKTYRPIHKTASGWISGDPPGPLPLYQLPEVLKAVRVYVSEGEKCADLATKIGLVATTPAYGAKSPHKSDWAPLAGKEVVILPDADGPGEGFAKAVVALLSRFDPAPSVRIVRLPGLGDGGDIEQWLADRADDPTHDGPGRDQARADLEALADSTPVEMPPTPAEPEPPGERATPPDQGRQGPRWAPGTLVKALDRDNFGTVVEDFGDTVSVHFVSPSGYEATVTLPKSSLQVVSNGGEPPVWSGEPQAIQSKLLPVPAFSEALIPEPLRAWLVDIAERVSCSPDFPVVGAVNSLASLVGRKAGIRPKRQDDWKVVPNLWGAIVGRPGVFKTPALLEAMKPLHRLANESVGRFNEEMAYFAGDSLLVKLRAENAKDEVKKAVKLKKSDNEVAELVRLATAADGVKPPTCKRYLVNDPTVEKLGELLRDNPAGLLIFRDELTGWFRSLDKPGHESDRAFYLEAWNGGGAPFIYDRIGRGTVFIPSPCVSILGGIQPGPLRSYLKAVARGEDADDGLISRFQMIVYPDPPARWVNVDRWPDSAAKDRASDIFRRLDALDPTSVGAEADPEDGVPFFRFSADAQDLFDEWRRELENDKLRLDGQSPLIEAHLSKYRSLMPSLALLFHLVKCADDRTAAGPVSIEAARLSAAWCDYLEEHARRIYSSLDEGDNDAARALADRIKRGDVPDPFSTRDIYRKGWSNLTASDDVARAVATLEGLGWLASVETPNTGGAPRTDVHIHPSLIKLREAS